MTLLPSDVPEISLGSPDRRNRDGSTLDTVTVTDADVPKLFELSLATAVSTCVPLGVPIVFHGIEYVPEFPVVTSVPKLLPSSVNCTPAIATLSVAVALIVMLPATKVPPTGDVIETFGGVVSTANVVTVAGADCAETLPVGSDAETVYV